MVVKSIYELGEIFFHDSKILRVEELSEEQNIIFYLNYPTDWNNNVFEKRRLIFKDVTHYSIEQILFLGCPTILDYELETQTPERTSIVLKTNSGDRKITFKKLELCV